MKYLLSIILALLVGCGSSSPETTPVSAGSELVFDPSSLNQMESPEKVRASLIQFIFDAPSLPSRLPDRVDTFSSIDKLTILTEEGYTSFVYLMRPLTSNGELMIYHQGHGGDALVLGKATIETLLNNGFTVLALTMPGIGSNIGDPNHNNITNSLVPFLEPVAVALNYTLEQEQFNQVGMMGLSGGGWTTVIYSALDTRIDRSYPVAGSAPLYLGMAGDFEQFYPEYYSIAGYPVHYVLGTAGRKQIAMYNYHDPCCFSGDYAYDWVQSVNLKATEYGGSYQVVIDYDNPDHSISDLHLSVILTDMGI